MHTVSNGFYTGVVDASLMAGVAHYGKCTKSVIQCVDFFFAKTEDFAPVCRCR